MLGWKEKERDGKEEPGKIGLGRRGMGRGGVSGRGSGGKVSRLKVRASEGVLWVPFPFLFSSYFLPFIFLSSTFFFIPSSHYLVLGSGVHNLSL